MGGRLLEGLRKPRGPEEREKKKGEKRKNIERDSLLQIYRGKMLTFGFSSATVSRGTK